MKLSVAICTHNPRRDYLERTLNALKTQTLPKEQWELVVVDNASNPPLADALDLSWHTQSRIVSEAELGILPARVRGLKAARAPYILFVDDDNVLAPDYLEQALAVADTHPFLGVWGGNITPEFEAPPPPWINSVRCLLAWAEVPEDRWSNLKFNPATLPPTAGMCLRRPVADAFIRTVESDPRRQLLGRRGKLGLTNGEDTDLALTACDIGLGAGQFTRLKMTHLISPIRLDKHYLIRLAEGTSFCGVILQALRGRSPIVDPRNPLRLVLGWARDLLLSSRLERGLKAAHLRGHKRACGVVAAWDMPNVSVSIDLSRNDGCVR
jgi:glycosyltransferase involved in cell wall biosynthesis